MKTDYKKFIEASKREAEVEAEAEESQKPSARIKVLCKKRWGISWPDSRGALSWDQKLQSVVDYLDEQYEKEKRGE